jgi:DNA (cytosine-5)-methyltransferase 1
MGRPLRILDLYCKAGGATRGYQEAGFEAWGVDIEPQPHYVGEVFHRNDALNVLESFFHPWPEWKVEGFDAIHASPPCQAFTAYRRTGNVGDHPDLVAATRELLEATGLPWVMENVEGAPLVDPVVICGSMFEPPMDIRRHRLFETNWDLEPPMWPCRHKMQGGPRFPGGRSKERTGSSRGLVRATMEIGSWDIPLADQKQAMGIDWDVTLPELSNAIPPAYTRFIGEQLTHHLKSPDNELEEVA